MDYNLFLDSDVILDVVLQREGFYEETFPLFKMREEQTVLLYTSSSVLMNVQYVSTTFIGKNKATEGIKYLLNFLDILDSNKKIIVEGFQY